MLLMLTRQDAILWLNLWNSLTKYFPLQVDDMDQWKLVKRFFLVDTVSGRMTKLSESLSANSKRKEKLYEKFRWLRHLLPFFNGNSNFTFFSLINYIKSIELRFQLRDEPDKNRINIPLLIVEYGTLNLTRIADNAKTLGNETIDEGKLYNYEFSFKISFVKKLDLKSFFQVMLPIFSVIAFCNALMQTFFYKIRQQKIEYDLTVLSKLFMNVLESMSNAFFLFIVIVVTYVFFVYKTQSEEIRFTKIMSEDEDIIWALLFVALICKVCWWMIKRRQKLTF